MDDWRSLLNQDKISRLANAERTEFVSEQNEPVMEAKEVIGREELAKMYQAMMLANKNKHKAERKIVKGLTVDGESFAGGFVSDSWVNPKETINTKPGEVNDVKIPKANVSTEKVPRKVAKPLFVQKIEKFFARDDVKDYLLYAVLTISVVALIVSLVTLKIATDERMYVHTQLVSEYEEMYSSNEKAMEYANFCIDSQVNLLDILSEYEKRLIKVEDNLNLTEKTVTVDFTKANESSLSNFKNR